MLSLNIKFNEEGLNKIKDHKNVLLIRPIKEGSNIWMRAYIKTGKGEYEAVDVTKPQWCMEFPFEPILSLQFYLGKYYFDNFIIDDNMRALNKKEFVGFCSANCMGDPKKVAICAEFKDGSSVVYQNQKKKYFEKKGIYQLRKFLKNNGLEPKYGKISSSMLIDRFLNDEGKAVIPELKEDKSSSGESKEINPQIHKNSPSMM